MWRSDLTSEDGGWLSTDGAEMACQLENCKSLCSGELIENVILTFKPYMLSSSRSDFDPNIYVFVS